MWVPVTKETAAVHVFWLHGIPYKKCMVRVHSSPPGSGKTVWASVSLSSSLHPKTNGRTERYSQEMALQFIHSQNPSSWSRHLLQVEYTTTPSPWRPPASPHCSVSTNMNLLSFQSSGVGHGPLCPHSASQLFTVYMDKNLGSSPPHQHW